MSSSRQLTTTDATAAARPRAVGTRHQPLVKHPINSLGQLRTHLQWAIELEHATIPPYLCALYSLDPDRNPEAAQVIGSVMGEEMLHLALAANLLNAVGGHPRLDTPELLLPYPRPLPHGARDVHVNLLPFGPEALDLFLRIEQPAPADGPAEGFNYRTIGQFYAAIAAGLRDLTATLGEGEVFSGPGDRQIRDSHLHSTSGTMVVVDGLESALVALHEIVEQGEGAGVTDVWDGDRDVLHPDLDEVAHYYRFQELREGRRYQRGDTPQTGPTGEVIAVDFTAVRPMRANPGPSDFPAGSPIRVAQHEFNRTYCRLLQGLEEAFTGNPGQLGEAVGTMFAIRNQARSLMEQPTGDGRTTAGPTFEYVPPQRRG